MLERVFNPERLDAVIGHPSVKPHVSLGLDEVPSVGFLLDDPANVCLMNEHGGFLFRQFLPDQYDVHTMFLPSGRGKRALDAAREAKRIMFDEYHARRLVTFVPHENRPARKLAEAVGFVEDIEAECMGVPGVTMVLEATCQ